MNLNPYETPGVTTPARKTGRWRRPYLVLNGIFALIIFAMVLLPFLLPTIHITDISTTSNGDPVTSQTTLTTIEWSPLALVMMVIVIGIANGFLFLARQFRVRRNTI